MSGIPPCKCILIGDQVFSNGCMVHPARAAQPEEPLVWSIFDNAWVTLSYWKWVNGR